MNQLANAFSQKFFNTHARVAEHPKPPLFSVAYYSLYPLEYTTDLIILWRKNKMYYINNYDIINTLAVISALKFCSKVPDGLILYSILLTHKEACEICYYFGLHTSWS